MIESLPILSQINQAIIGVVPFLPIIFGLVEFFKQLGVKGQFSLVASMFLGLLFGAFYWAATQGAPATFLGWFGLVVFGLMLGLTTSGVYDFADSRWPKTRSLVSLTADNYLSAPLASMADQLQRLRFEVDGLLKVESPPPPPHAPDLPPSWRP